MDSSGHVVGKDGKPIQVKITGSILDADTGEPLPAFYLTKGALNRDRRNFDWDEKSRQLLTRGAFSLDLRKETMPPAVMIEATGYLPQHSGPIRALETNLTFRLKKGQGPSGVILTPAGRPAAGCTVYLSPSRDQDLLLLEGPKLTAKTSTERVRSTVTDQAGRFSFTPVLDDFGVLVADDAGFASVRVEDLRASPELRLRPWARVEGSLKIGASPGSHETVRLADAFAEFAYYPRRVPPYSILAETTTDATGHFVFSRVPPVDVKVFHAPKTGAKNTRVLPITQITNLTLKAGEIRGVTIGGEGRPVVGRVVLKNYAETFEWQDAVFWMESTAPVPSDCPNFEAIEREFHSARKTAQTQEEKDAAEDRYLAEREHIAQELRAYYSSPPGRQYWFSKRRYVLRFAPDGAFRVDDVPGGKYELTLDPREEFLVQGKMHAGIIDLHRQEVDVPDSPGGRSDTPLDLGVIKMLAQLRQGDAPADFTFQTVDGKSAKLSDYKGKYVLLDFWATGDAASSAALPDLKETYATNKNNPRFAMLGLSLDTNITSVRDFAGTNLMGWTQGFLGPWSQSEVADRFGVESLPFVVMLDPAGRVFAAGLHGRSIEGAAEMALTPHE